MIQCQNCGQVNAGASNFCRFCGTRFQNNQISNDSRFDQQQQQQPPPRPYSWKTDEFQVAEAPPRQKSRQINQVQPLANPQQQHPAFNPPPRPQPLMYQKPAPPPQQHLAYNTFCPRCASQFIKYERKVSTAGWIVFAALMITFFPLFWIGLLIKEDVRVCQTCNYKIS